MVFPCCCRSFPFLTRDLRRVLGEHGGSLGLRRAPQEVKRRQIQSPIWAPWVPVREVVLLFRMYSYIVFWDMDLIHTHVCGKSATLQYANYQIVIVCLYSWDLRQGLDVFKGCALCVYFSAAVSVQTARVRVRTLDSFVHVNNDQIYCFSFLSPHGTRGSCHPRQQPWETVNKLIQQKWFQTCSGEMVTTTW